MTTFASRWLKFDPKTRGGVTDKTDKSPSDPPSVSSVSESPLPFVPETDAPPLTLSRLRDECSAINARVKQDGRLRVRAWGMVEIPCAFLDQVVRFRVHDARLRVDGFAGCIQESGRCPAADPVKCWACDRGYTFVGLDDCRCGEHA